VVRPPFSGVISEKFVELGQHVQPGEPLVRITDVSVVEVPLALPLRDYSKIADTLRTGERPTVQLAVNETEAARWTGEVVRVAPRADEQTRTVSVFVRVQNEQQSVPLLPGTFVQGRIAGPMLQDVLVVPRDAIRNDTIVVARKGEAAIVPIEVRERVQNLAVVTGLKPGDLAVLTNLDVLRDKSRVKIGAKRTIKDELRR
jgi:RND family efflux transporter MFP subunit